MHVSRDWIEAHIPHQGPMCLLDEVLKWDATHIRCRTGTHRDADHPLRSQNRLGIACGIEYAAQTMAVHGALLAQAAGAAEARTEVGLLAGVRDVRLYALRLDDIAADLFCEARRIAGDGGTALYEFALWSLDMRLLSGRATVVLDASGRLNL